MNNKVIGILGGNGNLGKCLLKQLENDNYTILVGNRTKKKEIINQYIFDIKDKSSLDDFIEKTNVIVNCTGPSFYVGDLVLKSALQYKKDYIDPFGDNYIIKNHGNINISRVILSSGDYPGFTGVLISWIKEKYFDDIEKVFISYKGGGEVSSAGLLDLLMSTSMEFGKLNFYYYGGKYKSSNKLIQNEHNFLLNKEVYMTEFINNEAIDVGKKLEIHEVHFRNMYSNEKEYDFLNSIYVNMINKKSYESKMKYLDAVISGFSNENNKMDKSIYSIEARGKKNGKNEFKKFEILGKNSNTISAYMLKKSIELLITSSLINGVYRPFEVLDAIDTMNEMIENKLILEMKEINKYNNEEEYETGKI